MSADEMEAFWEANDGEFLKDENIPLARRLHRRPDLNAFLLLDNLCPGPNKSGYFTDMVSAAEHDEIWLAVEPEEITHATEDDLLDLIRCGVRFDGESFCMFV